MSDIQPVRLINIYCDESCHLEHSFCNIMSFGAIYCPDCHVGSISQNLRDIKEIYNCNGELKWTKVSIKNLDFYKSILSFFFGSDTLRFRCLIVHNKQALNHKLYNEGEHDTFYYKMYYYTLKYILENSSQPHAAYFDIKDTRSNTKIRYLKEVLARLLHDKLEERLIRVQQIRSHESELLQLSDFLLGVLTYAMRLKEGECGLDNIAKVELVKILQTHLSQSIYTNTAYKSPKLNIFHFYPRLTDVE